MAEEETPKTLDPGAAVRNGESAITLSSRFSLDAVRIERAMPDYRLAKRGGELVLQRAFLWEKGSVGGHEWRDVPMALEDDGDVNNPL